MCARKLLLQLDKAQNSINPVKSLQTGSMFLFRIPCQKNMVQLKINDPGLLAGANKGNSSLTSAMILVTKINESNSTAAAFLIWKSSRLVWNCEYYCIKDTQVPENMTITKAGNLNSALDFWSDLLGLSPTRIILNTDLNHDDWTTGVRVSAHQIKVKRSRNNLPSIEHLHGKDDGPLRGNVVISRYYNDVMEHLIDEGSDRGRQKFKDQIQEILKPNRVRFTRVTIS